MPFAIALCTASVSIGALAAGSQASRDTARPALAHQQVVDAPHATVTIGTVGERLAFDQPITLAVDVAPGPRMHVYAPDEKDYIPVALTVDPQPGVTVGKPAFPKAEAFFFEPLQQVMQVYSQPFRITAAVTTAGGSARRARAAGPFTVTGTLDYQACNDTVCYRPSSVTLRWTLPIRARSSR